MFTRCRELQLDIDNSNVERAIVENDEEAQFDPEARARMENAEGFSEEQVDPISTTSSDD